MYEITKANGISRWSTIYNTDGVPIRLVLGRQTDKAHFTKTCKETDKSIIFAVPKDSNVLVKKSKYRTRRIYGITQSARLESVEIEYDVDLYDWKTFCKLLVVSYQRKGYTKRVFEVISRKTDYFTFAYLYSRLRPLVLIGIKRSTQISFSEIFTYLTGLGQIILECLVRIT